MGRGGRWRQYPQWITTRGTEQELRAARYEELAKFSRDMCDREDAVVMAWQQLKSALAELARYWWFANRGRR